MKEPDLDSLRREVGELDRQLLQTAARRLEIVQAIAERKAAEGSRPLFDRERELTVLRDAERTGLEAGLAPGVGERLLRVLVDASHETQSRILHRHATRAHDGAPIRFLIVGGLGLMGRLLGRAFSDRGHLVESLDVGGGADRSRRVEEADVVMVSVSMNRVVEVVEELGPHVRPDALLCDINSLKGEVTRAMERSCRGEILGLHPMFGPSVHTLRRQKIVVCPVRPGERGRRLLAEFGRMGLEMIETDPDTHDRMMAVVQVMVHFSTLVMGRALEQTGISVEESLRYTSPIYRLELAFVGRLFAQDPDLYAEIEMGNPGSAAIRRHFLAAAAEADRIVASGDREAFVRMFESTAGYFAGFAEEAMATSDYIIDRLVERP